MNENLIAKWNIVADKATNNYSSLSKSERVWVNARVLIDSINNGGLISYYYNSGAEHLYDLLVDLKTLNINHIAEIIERYNLILFPDSLVPENINTRNEVIGNLDETRNDLIQTIEDEIFSFVPEIETSLDKFLETNFK